MSQTGFVGLLLVCVLSAASAQMILVSPEFKNFERIPQRFCCDVYERDSYRPSIPLSWARVPAKAQSFVLVMDEMETEMVHWAIKDIPRDTRSIEADASETNMPSGSIELPTSFGYDFYSGPCPETPGTHHYRFRLFAMPTLTTQFDFHDDPSSMRSPSFIAQVEAQSLYVSVLVGNFSFSAVEMEEAAQRRAEANNRTTEPSTDGLSLKTGSPPTPAQTQARPRNSTVPTEDTRRSLNTTRVRGPRNATRLAGVGAHVAIGRGAGPSTDAEVQTLGTPSSSAEGTPVTQTLPDDEEPSARTQPGATRVVHAGEQVVQHRFIKPSEAFKNGPQRLPDPCAGAQSDLLDECIAVQAENEVRDERLWNCGSRSKTGMHFTRKGETERCAMRVRYADVSCAKQVFPRQYVCDAHRSTDHAQSPALEWRDAPADVQSFVVTVEDASSPRFDDQGKLLWLVANVPRSYRAIGAGASGHAMPPLSVELKNSFHFAGYTAPCPGPSDQRRYVARVYAMPHPTTSLFLSGDVRARDVQAQLQKLALCISTTELPFSYAASVVTPSQIVTEAVVTEGSAEVVPGEVTVA